MAFNIVMKNIYTFCDCCDIVSHILQRKSQKLILMHSALKLRVQQFCNVHRSLQPEGLILF